MMIGGFDWYSAGARQTQDLESLSSFLSTGLSLEAAGAPNASFTPTAASCGRSIEDAICHVRDVVRPLVTCKQVDHREALGGRQVKISRPFDAQLSRTGRHDQQHLGREFSAALRLSTGQKARVSRQP